MKHASLRYTFLGIALLMVLIALFNRLVYQNIRLRHRPFTGPSIVEIIEMFQFIAFSGMYSVRYPGVYRVFTTNFSWSLGIFGWPELERRIDTLRERTGDGQGTSYSSLHQRDFAEDVPTGIEAFFDTLGIPPHDALVLLVVWFAIVMASMATLLVLARLALALKCAKRRRVLRATRTRFVTVAMSVFVRLGLIFLAPVSVLAVYNFLKNGSWATQIIAALTMAAVVVALFIASSRVAWLAVNNNRELYKHPTITLYGTLYEKYKTRYWWWYIPKLTLMFVFSLILACGTANGLLQLIITLAIELAAMIITAICHPYESVTLNVFEVFKYFVRVAVLVMIVPFNSKSNDAGAPLAILGVTIIALQCLWVLLTLMLVVLALVSTLYELLNQPPQRPRRRYVSAPRPQAPIVLSPRYDPAGIKDLNTPKAPMISLQIPQVGSPMLFGTEPPQNQPEQSRLLPTTATATTLTPDMRGSSVYSPQPSPQLSRISSFASTDETRYVDDSITLEELVAREVLAASRASFYSAKFNDGIDAVSISSSKKSLPSSPVPQDLSPVIKNSVPPPLLPPPPPPPPRSPRSPRSHRSSFSDYLTYLSENANDFNGVIADKRRRSEPVDELEYLAPIRSMTFTHVSTIEEDIEGST